MTQKDLVSSIEQDSRQAGKGYSAPSYEQTYNKTVTAGHMFCQEDSFDYQRESKGR